MKVQQFCWHPQKSWVGNDIPSKTTVNSNSQLVLFFGSRETMIQNSLYHLIQELYPHARIMGCSTGGTISNSDVVDDEVQVTAIEFSNTKINLEYEAISGSEDSFLVGKKLSGKLVRDDLQGIFLLSDGLNINGSELVQGFKSVLGNKIPITGGLAGDGEKFQQTVLTIDAITAPKLVAAVGFYGSHLEISYGSAGGWENFGPERLITKSQNNILYELDSKPALELYKRYLGDESENLPKSALLFPLSIRKSRGMDQAVRTVLSVNEQDNSMTFAGDIPIGWVAQLMHSNHYKLIEGAEKAAKESSSTEQSSATLSILISCIGRRLLMGNEPMKK